MLRFKYLLPIMAAFSLIFSIRYVVLADQTKPKKEPLIEPTRSTFNSPLAGSGIIEPITETISVGSPVTGVVEAVFVEVGDDVQENQPLFKIDDRHLQAELLVRKANLATAEATLAKWRALPRPEELPISEAKVAEIKSLLEDAKDHLSRAERGRTGGAIPEEEYSRRRYNVATIQQQLARAEAELHLLREGAWKPDIQTAEAAVFAAQAQVKVIETEIERHLIRARSKGKILQKNIRKGEYINLNGNNSLILMGDISTLHIRVDIDEADIGRFSPELIGKAFTRGANKIETPIRFVRIEPNVVPKRSLTGAGSERVDTRVLQIIYKVDQAHPKLYVGQQVDVYLGKE
jgi:multidrug efflux pump subunit AcrA (membrane-fusion protein)